MADPCEQAETISKLGKEQSSQGVKIDTVLNNQEVHSVDFKNAIDKLTDILIDSTRHTEGISQLRVETHALFEKERVLKKRVTGIEVRNAKCDGAGIFEKWDTVYDFVQQEKGWRRFLPATMAGLAWIATIITFFVKHIGVAQ